MRKVVGRCAVETPMWTAKFRQIGMTCATHAMFKRLVDNFYAKSPLFRYLMCAGKARKSMRRYRATKRIRRPVQFRQDVW
jgi:hypothetical protein